MPLVRHRLVVRHPSGTALLVGRFGSKYSLPCLELDDHHTAEVDVINAAIHSRWNLTTTTLRCFDDFSVAGRAIRSYDLEAQDDTAPSGYEWWTIDGIHKVRWAHAADALCFAVWRSAAPGPEWMRPGWWNRARIWLADALSMAGHAELESLVQRRVWEFSTLLEVRTRDGSLYFFKAMPFLQREWSVTCYLAECFPDALPRIAVADRERLYLLMHAFPGERLEGIGDLGVWRRAVAHYARLQRESISHVDELRSRGCEERSARIIDGQIDELCADEGALCCDDPDALTPNELAILHKRAGDLHDYCRRLEALGLPLTLEHGDLWPSNILASPETSVVLDWDEAAVGNPLFSLAPLLAGLRFHQPQLVADAGDVLREVYLEEFSHVVSPQTLSEAFSLALPLAFLEMGLRYRAQPPSIARLHPWMYGLVPFFTRLALQHLESSPRPSASV